MREWIDINLLDLIERYGIVTPIEDSDQTYNRSSTGRLEDRPPALDGRAGDAGAAEGIDG